MTATAYSPRTFESWSAKRSPDRDEDDAGRQAAIHALVQAPLARGDPAPARIRRRRRADHAPEPFRRRFEEVMRVPAADLRDVEREPSGLRERLEEMRIERRVEATDGARRGLEVGREVRPAAQVDRDVHEALVH